MPGKSSHAQVVYHPLANKSKDDKTNLEIDGEEDELEVITGDGDGSENINDNNRNSSGRTYNASRYFSRQHARNPIGLRQFRTILLAVASVLLIIFILKLATYSSHTRQVYPNQARSNVVETFTHARNESAAESLHKIGDHDQQTKSKPVASSQWMVSTLNTHREPAHDDRPSFIVFDQDHKPKGISENESKVLDDFSYSIGDQRFTEARNNWWTIETRNRQQVTVSNYVRAMKSFNYNASVTLVTHLILKSQSFHHSLEMCERWDGPISISIFLSRGLNELPLAISLIKFVRLCLPAPLSACMQDKITWHLVYTEPNADIESLKSSLSYPKHHLDRINYSSFADTDQCPKFANTKPSELIRQFQADILAKNNMSAIPLSGNGSASKEATAPLNVLRNVARRTANTKYVLVTNIELYPSFHLARNFIRLVNESISLNSTMAIFALPAFEMNMPTEGETAHLVAKTKDDLVKLVSKGEAWPYQEAGCNWCHEFSERREWLNAVTNQSDKMTVYDQVRWTHSGVRAWSPFFLAQNSYPDYNENLLTNERIDLLYEMCLKDYNLVVLDNGFLVKLKNSSILHLTSESSTSDLADVGSHDQLVERALSSLSEKYKDNVNVRRC